MSFKNVGKQLIEEVPYGMYVWSTIRDGEEWIVQDDDANVMNVFCMKGDRKALDAIAQAAKYYGFPEGHAVWWSGRRRINDEELEEQLLRQKFGLEPDPQNIPALTMQAREQHEHGR
jgi:hypothetical protein